MLENTEWTIKKGRQSRETGYIGYTRQRKTKQKSQHNICWTPLCTNNTYIVNKTWMCTTCIFVCNNIILLVQWSLSIPNPFRTKTFVWNRQVFGLDRLNALKFTILGLNLMFGLHRISFYSGFGLDGFHCITWHTKYRQKTPQADDAQH